MLQASGQWCWLEGVLLLTGACFSCVSTCTACTRLSAHRTASLTTQVVQGSSPVPLNPSTPLCHHTAMSSCWPPGRAPSGAQGAESSPQLVPPPSPSLLTSTQGLHVKGSEKREALGGQ